MGRESKYGPGMSFLLPLSGPDLYRQAELADGDICLCGNHEKPRGPDNLC